MARRFATVVLEWNFKWEKIDKGLRIALHDLSQVGKGNVR